MSERYYVGVYWGARKESAAQCARRLHGLLDALAPVDPLFSRWFQQARLRKQALQRPVPSDVASITEFVAHNVMRDDRRQPMEELGFSVWLWNGGSGGNDVGLHSGCGGFSEHVPNYCLVDPPSAGPGMERVLTSSVLNEVLRAMALAWAPDWGVVMSRAHERLLPREPSAHVRVGWATYLSTRWGTVPSLPAPVRVEPVEDRGSLILLTPERFTASNSEHVALADRVRELLAPMLTGV